MNDTVTWRIPSKLERLTGEKLTPAEVWEIPRSWVTRTDGWFEVNYPNCERPCLLTSSEIINY